MDFCGVASINFEITLDKKGNILSFHVFVVLHSALCYTRYKSGVSFLMFKALIPHAHQCNQQQKWS